MGSSFGERIENPHEPLGKCWEKKLLPTFGRKPFAGVPI